MQIAGWLHPAKPAHGSIKLLTAGIAMELVPIILSIPSLLELIHLIQCHQTHLMTKVESVRLSPGRCALQRHACKDT